MFCHAGFNGQEELVHERPDGAVLEACGLLSAGDRTVVLAAIARARRRLHLRSRVSSK